MTDAGRTGSALAWDRVGRLLVCVHGTGHPDQKQWSALLAWVRHGSVPLAETVVLIRSFGGGPNAVQRGMLTDMFTAENVKPKTVVLTDSPVARGFGIALSWFNPAVRILALDKLVQAFDHLELDDDERREATILVERLSQEIEHQPGLQAP